MKYDNYVLLIKVYYYCFSIWKNLVYHLKKTWSGKILMEDLNLEYDLRSTHTIPQGKILKIQTFLENILQIINVVSDYW